MILFFNFRKHLTQTIKLIFSPSIQFAINIDKIRFNPFLFLKKCYKFIGIIQIQSVSKLLTDNNLFIVDKRFCMPKNSEQRKGIMLVFHKKSIHSTKKSYLMISLLILTLVCFSISMFSRLN